MTRAPLFLVLVVRAAAAEPVPVDVEAGVGVRATWGPGDYLAPIAWGGRELGLALATNAGLGFTPHLRIGAHLAAAHATYGPCSDLYSFDVGPALAYRDPRFTLTTWLGRHFSRLSTDAPRMECVLKVHGDWTEDFTSYGATASVSVYRELAVFLDAQSATGGVSLFSFPNSSTFNYTAVTLGVAYRR